MIGRSAVREHVFKLLFESLFYTAEEMTEVEGRYFEDPDRKLDDESRDLIRDRYGRIYGLLDEIDAMIEEKSEGWKVGRMGKVELSILRLAVYEIRYDDDIPVGVAINEAVKLAKKYGQEQAGSFVNGVLAKFA